MKNKNEAVYDYSYLPYFVAELIGDAMYGRKVNFKKEIEKEFGHTVNFNKNVVICGKTVHVGIKRKNANAIIMRVKTLV